MNHASNEVAYKQLSVEGILFVHVSSVPSTMDTAVNEFPYLLENPDKMIAFSSNSQTQGRGSQTRTWVSVGECVAMSIACLVPRDAPHVELGHILAISAVRALNRSCGIDEFVIKWPNDILLRGLKVGGVLVESHTCPAESQIVVLGIGINIDVPNAGLPSRPVWPAGSIHQILKVYKLNADQLRREIATEFYHDLAEWRLTGFQSFVHEMRDSLLGVGEYATVFSTDGEALTGTISGVGCGGGLQLRQTDGVVREIHSGDIRFDPRDR